LLVKRLAAMRDFVLFRLVHLCVCLAVILERGIPTWRIRSPDVLR